MAVIPIKTELKCKLCKHPKRGEIDALIEKRSAREINLVQLLDALAILGVDHPTEDNVKGHWKRHCERVTAEAAAAIENAASELWQEWVENAPDGTDPTEYARWQLDGWKRMQIARVEAGEEPIITTDHAQKAAALLVQAKGDDARAALMSNVGAAISAHVRAALPAPTVFPSADIVIEEKDVVEA